MCAEALSRIAILGKIMTGELCPDDALELLIGAPERSAAQTQAGDGLRAVEADELDAATMAHVQLRGRLEAKLIDIIGAEARIPTSRISPREPFERYGFDSVMALNVVRVLQLDFAELSPTVLFEYQTITALAEYLVERWHKETIQALGDPIAAASMVGGLPVPSAASEPPLSSSLEPAALEPDRTPENEIAIIGLSCRFPLADDLEAFWSNLKEGKDCITEIPSERWDQRLYFDPEKGKPGKSYSKWGGFLSDADCFDGAFFHISPREAERMDPQERLVLEEVWHALEDGALTREHLAEQTVGVYVGVMYSQYQLLEAEEAMNGNFLYLGSSYASIANHVSYFFNFGGPSIALDTMCSSSLTAIHLACQALRSGEIHVAVAGGVNLTIHPNKHVDLSQGRFASSDGRCRSFGVDGDGYVPGEGVGIVILKPFSAAVAEGDRIYAVIR